jgi:hypothetical protein
VPHTGGTAGLQAGSAPRPGTAGAEPRSGTAGAAPRPGTAGGALSRGARSATWARNGSHPAAGARGCVCMAARLRRTADGAAPADIPGGKGQTGATDRLGAPFALALR